MNTDNSGTTTHEKTILDIPAKGWREIAAWAKKTNKLTPQQRRLAFIINLSMSEGWTLYKNQLEEAQKIIDELKLLLPGFLDGLNNKPKVP